MFSCWKQNIISSTNCWIFFLFIFVFFEKLFFLKIFFSQNRNTFYVCKQKFFQKKSPSYDTMIWCVIFENVNKQQKRKNSRILKWQRIIHINLFELIISKKLLECEYLNWYLTQCCLKTSIMTNNNSELFWIVYHQLEALKVYSKSLSISLER